MPTALGAIGNSRSATATAGRPGTRTGGARATLGVATTQWRGTQQRLGTVLSGSTSHNYSLVSFRKVYVYDRDTGKLLQMVRSNGAGLFSFKGLPVASDKYFAVLEQQINTGSWNLAALDHISQP